MHMSSSEGVCAHLRHAITHLVNRDFNNLIEHEQALVLAHAERVKNEYATAADYQNYKLLCCSRSTIKLELELASRSHQVLAQLHIREM